MLVTTVAAIEGRPVQWYLGIVAGEVVVGTGGLPDAIAAAAETNGCEHQFCTAHLREARQNAILAMLREAAERGANAVIGVGLAYEQIHVRTGGGALMVAASGTAVRV